MKGLTNRGVNEHEDDGINENMTSCYDITDQWVPHTIPSDVEDRSHMSFT
jgi:hypothetical protein